MKRVTSLLFLTPALSVFHLPSLPINNHPYSQTFYTLLIENYLNNLNSSEQSERTANGHPLISALKIFHLRLKLHLIITSPNSRNILNQNQCQTEMNNKNAQKSDSLLSSLFYKELHVSDKRKQRYYNFNCFWSIYNVPCGNPVTFFLTLLLLTFSPSPKDDSSSCTPTTTIKPKQTQNSKIRERKKAALILNHLLNCSGYFFPPSFLPSLFPQLYKNKTHKTNKQN